MKTYQFIEIILFGWKLWIWVNLHSQFPVFSLSTSSYPPHHSNHGLRERAADLQVLGIHPHCNLMNFLGFPPWPRAKFPGSLCAYREALAGPSDHFQALLWLPRGHFFLLCQPHVSVPSSLRGCPYSQLGYQPLAPLRLRVRAGLRGLAPPRLQYCI